VVPDAGIKGNIVKNKGFTLIELMVVIVILGLLAAVAIFNFINMQMRAKEASVKSTCHTVQLAVEDFAVQNEGFYAANLADITPSGDTIIDMLPGGILIENPFTRLATEPVNGAAANPGETGYQVLMDAGMNVGYIITGFGRHGQILRLSNGN
jgi:prepilin-type N-terminal cleavage/methylation domain-containing protein